MSSQPDGEVSSRDRRPRPERHARCLNASTMKTVRKCLVCLALIATVSCIYFARSFTTEEGTEFAW